MKPPEEIFQEIKKEAIKIWLTYDDTHGYATEKISRIKDVSNDSEDSWIPFYGMFDSKNKAKLNASISEEANNFISQNY